MQSIKMCAFFKCWLILIDNGMCPVFVNFIVALFSNLTLGQLCVSLISVRTNWSSAFLELFDSPLSAFLIIVSCLGGSMI